MQSYYFISYEQHEIHMKKQQQMLNINIYCTIHAFINAHQYGTNNISHLLQQWTRCFNSTFKPSSPNSFTQLEKKCMMMIRFANILNFSDFFKLETVYCNCPQCCFNLAIFFWLDSRKKKPNYSYSYCHTFDIRLIRNGLW